MDLDLADSAVIFSLSGTSGSWRRTGKPGTGVPETGGEAWLQAVSAKRTVEARAFLM